MPHEELKNYPEHEVWERAGFYLAQLAVNVFFTTSVETIVIGGGLSHSPRLFGYIVKNFDKLINGYVKIPQAQRDEDHPILKRAVLDSTNGLFGAVLAFNDSEL